MIEIRFNSVRRKFIHGQTSFTVIRKSIQDNINITVDKFWGSYGTSIWFSK